MMKSAKCHWLATGHLAVHKFAVIPNCLGCMDMHALMICTYVAN